MGKGWFGRAVSVIWLLASSASAVAQPLPALREGDLLFQDLDCGPLCEAIEAVTEGVEGRDFSHVGIAAKIDGRMVVVEAIGPDVHATDPETFFKRSSKVVVGRPIGSLRRVARSAAHEAVALLGTPYDDAFLPGSDKLYCSELVALSYERAKGVPIFLAPPMTFKDPRTGEFFLAWINYYDQLDLEIPEGLPGCNPGGLSRDASIEIIWRSS